MTGEELEKVTKAEKEAARTQAENEAYIRRKVRNMLAMERKTVVRFGNYAVEIPNPELVEGMGVEFKK